MNKNRLRVYLYGNRIYSRLGKLASEVTKQLGGTEEKKTEKSTGPYKVQVSITDLNIRKGPGTNYAATGKYTGKGTFTITEEKSGKGSDKGWGKLKSGAGWVALDYVKKL